MHVNTCIQAIAAQEAQMQEQEIFDQALAALLPEADLHSYSHGHSVQQSDSFQGTNYSEGEYQGQHDQYQSANFDMGEFHHNQVAYDEAADYGVQYDMHGYAQGHQGHAYMGSAEASMFQPVVTPPSSSSLSATTPSFTPTMFQHHSPMGPPQPHAPSGMH